MKAKARLGDYAGGVFNFLKKNSPDNARLKGHAQQDKCHHLSFIVHALAQFLDRSQNVVGIATHMSVKLK